MISPSLGIRLLPIFVPFATQWVRMQEKRALRFGVPLNGEELADASALGVRNPDRVRLLRVEKMPTFENAALRPLAGVAERCFAHTAGLTLNYAILVQRDYWRERSLVAHELVHVGQYERLGGIGPFLRLYLRECLVPRYPNGPLEQEAILESARIR